MKDRHKLRIGIVANTRLLFTLLGYNVQCQFMEGIASKPFDIHSFC